MAYVVLWRLGPGTIGQLIHWLLGLLPLIGAFALTLEAWSERHKNGSPWVWVLFLVAGIVSLLFFFLGPYDAFKQVKKPNSRRRTKSIFYVLGLMVASACVLCFAALEVYAGTELATGSRAKGVLLGFAGLAIVTVANVPKARWNLALKLHRQLDEFVQANSK